MIVTITALVAAGLIALTVFAFKKYANDDPFAAGGISFVAIMAMVTVSFYSYTLATSLPDHGIGNERLDSTETFDIAERTIEGNYGTGPHHITFLTPEGEFKEFKAETVNHMQHEGHYSKIEKRTYKTDFGFWVFPWHYEKETIRAVVK